MKIALCLDDRNGMSFAGRRQSMDEILRQDLLLLVKGHRLWMSPYSAAQFDSLPENVQVDGACLEKAGQEDWCFVEDGDVLSVQDRVTQFAIYRWNRHYPSDRKFPLEVFQDRWKLESCREFPGKSHENITLEVYTL
jgi:hypothetical protein